MKRVPGFPNYHFPSDHLALWVEYVVKGKKERKQILRSFDGIIKAGELCVVLGRPGSGCSTLLKALTGELHGLDTDESVIHYNGIEQHKVIKEFKGETVYNQEVLSIINPLRRSLTHSLG